MEVVDGVDFFTYVRPGERAGERVEPRPTRRLAPAGRRVSPVVPPALAPLTPTPLRRGADVSSETPDGKALPRRRRLGTEQGAEAASSCSTSAWSPTSIGRPT
jgi:hypothetical protein